VALQKRGVIIRDMCAYDMPEWVRVTIGTMEQNTRFIRELNLFITPPATQPVPKCH
jgi:histidinol-phosphate aminotransferase